MLKHPGWDCATGPVHGVVLREALPQPGRPDLGEAVRALRTRGILPDWPAWGADQVHGDRLGWAPLEPMVEDDPALSVCDGAVRIYEYAATDGLATAVPGTLLIIRTADCFRCF